MFTKTARYPVFVVVHLRSTTKQPDIMELFYSPLHGSDYEYTLRK